jgi:hypothetical protein
MFWLSFDVSLVLARARSYRMLGAFALKPSNGGAKALPLIVRL